MQKSHNAKRGKGGFTLAELSVVLALLVIVGTMIISFSALMSGLPRKIRRNTNVWRITPR